MSSSRISRKYNNKVDRCKEMRSCITSNSAVWVNDSTFGERHNFYGSTDILVAPDKFQPSS